MEYSLKTILDFGKYRSKEWPVKKVIEQDPLYVKGVKSYYPCFDLDQRSSLYLEIILTKLELSLIKN